MEFHAEACVTGIKTDGGHVTGVTVDAAPPIEADFYIAALPVERMASLLTDDLRRAAPSIANLDKLQTRWMNGIQFYLAQDVPVVNGHAIYLDSPWALTSISQRQFWTCTAVQIQEEVWTQLKQALNVGDAVTLDDANLLSWFLDPDIQFPNPGTAANAEPLLINTAGSLQYRPETQIELENLFLASDYVRTYTDIACMEAANQAARRAVNCLLLASGSSSSPAQLWPLEEPAFLKPLQEIDRIRFGLRLPHHLTL